jgi:hypothetical protein
MTEMKIPKNYPNVTEIRALSVKTSVEICKARLPSLADGNVEVFYIDSTTQPPWHDANVWALLEKQVSLQLIIVTNEVNAYEIALCAICLQKGFEVFLILPNPSHVSETVKARLRQMSVVILSDDEAEAELRLSNA